MLLAIKAAMLRIRQRCNRSLLCMIYNVVLFTFVCIGFALSSVVLAYANGLARLRERWRERSAEREMNLVNVRNYFAQRR